MLAIFAIPILACAMIGERAAVLWTLASIAWAVSIAVTIPPTDPLFFGLAWSAAVVVGVVGFALIVLETSRTKARIESEQAHKELFTQRERLLAFAENTFPAIAETIGNKMHYVSDGLTNILGYQPQEFRQRLLNEYVHPDDLSVVLQQLNQVSIRGMHCEIRMRHKLGHWVWLEVFAIPQGPEPDRWIFAGRNIESEKQHRETIQRSERLESVGLLAAGLAHDFNNLLTVTLGFSEMLPKSEPRDEIIQATTQAGRLTQQLMSFARVDGAGSAATDVVRLTNNLRPMIRAIMGDNIEIVIDGNSNQMFAALPSTQLHQVILIWQQMPEPRWSTPGEFRVGLNKVNIGPNNNPAPERLRSGNYVELRITDTGYGMDLFTQQHAFDPFFSTKEDSRQSGLGLASVYGIVTNAKGHISLTSAEGQGTSVYILLPAADTPVPRREIKVDTAAEDWPTSDRMLLVVEEDISVRTLMVHTLETAGFSVETAKSLPEAVEMTLTLEPDLLVCDRGLSSKRDASRVAALQQRFPELKILYTGSLSQPNPAEWEELDQVRYLAKPYRSSDLIHAARMLVNPHR